jgi:hypothetical protein
MTGNDRADFRPLNVTLRPGSRALEAYAKSARIPGETLAAGFGPHPELNLRNFHGRTIADLAYVNCYLGGSTSWIHGDRSNIDRALEDAMTDDGLESIIAQYFQGQITSRALGSEVVDNQLGQRFFNDEAEQLVVQLASDGVLGDADAANSVINMMLPEGVILVDGNSDGSEEEESPRAPKVLVDDDQADSTHGLAGYHGSVPHNGAFVYYAVGVYSKGDNGIDAFDEPWKNVVATFYHELNEARTDADVEDVNRTGRIGELGWYSRHGGEIGDIPMLLASDLSLVMKEVVLGNGRRTPIQLMWSNKEGGPAEPSGAATGAVA